MDTRGQNNNSAVTSGFGVAPKSDPDATYLGPPRPSAINFALGTTIGGRYEILQQLGEGGMGAVYKAHDREVDKIIALKVIRPELANNQEILQRFKQELVTAREVTHRNVIRIYDLGEAEGVKFITMEYIQGRDLRAVLREKGKLSPGAAVEIMEQIVAGLNAAHEQGIIHRDLKPGNIVQDENGRIVVMDFGLARSLGNDGMTQTGMMLGTFEYMSPEQARAETLDARSDLFAVGLIFYELLTGNVPYKAETAIASLLKRTQEAAVPPSSIDAAIPKEISRMVCKCLERDRNHRYQSGAELLTDLKKWEGGAVAGSLNFPPVKPWGQDIPWHLVGVVAAVLVLSIVAFVFRGQIFRTGPRVAASGPSVSLAVVPFRNASGDASLDWFGTSAAEMLGSEIGQSNALRTVSSERVRQALNDLQIRPSSDLDPGLVKRIAEFGSADTVLFGQYVRLGDQIQIDAILRDYRNDRATPIKIVATNQKDISNAIHKLAEAVRQNLAMPADVIKELEASSFEPTSSSPAALRDYNRGLQLHREGRNLDARKLLESATEEDPSFALGFALLSQAYSDLGYDSDAERASRKAMSLAPRLPAAERALIEANNARILKNSKQAIEAYERLTKSFPSNMDVRYELGSLYMSTGDYDKARTQFTKLLLEEPKNIRALWQMGAVEIMSDHTEAAIDPLTRALTIAVQTDNEEEKALVLHALGVTYRLLNKPEDAVRNYEQAMEINKRLGLKRNLAVNYTEFAQVQTMTGKPAEALKSYQTALEIQREIGARKESGDTLLDMAIVYENKGEYDKALQGYKDALQIERDANDENYQALCLNNIGVVYLSKGDLDNALTYLQQALQLRQKLNVAGDLAETESHLGDVYSASNQYEDALSSYMKSLELYRNTGNARGAAAVSHSTGVLFEHQGRFDAAIGSMRESEMRYRAIGERSREMVETLSDLAGTLGASGSFDGTDKLLQEATSIATDLNNESLRALVLNTQGNIAFFRGDVAGAERNYREALGAAAKGTEKDKQLVSKLNLAKVAVAQGRLANGVRELPGLIEQANRSGLRLRAMESSVDLAQAMINSKDYARARQILESALNKSEKWGTKLETARIHFELGNAARLSGDSGDVAQHYKTAKSVLDELQKQSGAEHLLDRADLKTMYAAASQY